MRKKILLGSMLVLTLLLLMPSIPAVQQKTIEEGIKQDIQEKLVTINLNDLQDFNIFDGIRHPILFLIVISIANFQLSRFKLFYDAAIEYCTETLPDDFVPQFTHPILFLILMARAYWFLFTTWTWVDFWNYISESLRWNWNIRFE